VEIWSEWEDEWRRRAEVRCRRKGTDSGHLETLSSIEGEVSRLDTRWGQAAQGAGVEEEKKEKQLVNAIGNDSRAARTSGVR
jgi:hypothetical protein